VAPCHLHRATPGPEIPDGDAHFQIQANKFTFADFPLSGTTSIVYAPQDSVDVSVSQAVGIGELLILLADIDRGTTPACKYQWYKDGVPLTDAPTEDGYTDTITVSGAADAGSYHYTITHDRLPNLTLTSRVQEVTLTVPPIQREALIALYNATDGDNWTGIPEDKKWKQNGAFTDDISNWYGITLDGDGQVQIIVLQDKGLNGSIPKEIGNLSSLVRLYLDYNQLSGSIPKEIGDLSRLRSLGLIDNQLSGSIPPEIWNLSSLEYLKLHRNKLSGSIPWQIGNLSSLKWLSLEGNELSGSIPPEIGNLSSLVVLYLFDNQLSGSIPPEIGNLSSLRSLYLNSNELSGSIPPEIGNLSSLDRLYLHENELSGSIPQEIGNLSSVEYLNLSWNQLSGSIPPEFGNLSNLGRLYLYGNQLSGSIPREIGDMSSLEVLSLSNNQLSGSIPPEILNKGNKWSIFYNNFTFSDFPLSSPTPTINYIPQNEVDESHNFQSFVGQSLTLVANIDRSVTPPCKYQWFKDGTPLTDAPTEDGHTFTIASVTAADAGSYHYTITHDRLPTITLTSRLQEVTLTVPPIQREALIALYNATDGDYWNNYFPEEWKWKQDGAFTEDISNWYGITLDADQNVVEICLETTCGIGDGWGHSSMNNTIPPEIGNLTNLVWLSIPENGLTGSIPPEIKNLSRLSTLDLTSNQLSGPIPPEIGDLASLQVLKLADNTLSGSIPQEIGNLTNLAYLELTLNQLSGPIPKEIGNLSNLEYIFMYRNQLSGPIPAELGNLENVRNLFLSYNKLSGPIPLEILKEDQTISIEENNFVFADFPMEYQPFPFPFTIPVPYEDFNIFYDSQDSVDAVTTHSEFMGQPLTLVANIDRGVTPPCKYQWYKDGTPLTDAPTEDGHTYTITSMTAADAGSYHYTITHDRLPALTLISRVQEVVFLRPIQQSQKEALIAFYNSTDGDHWTNIPEEKKWKQEGQSGHEARNWEGITIDENGKVVQIDLQDKGLRGTVPEEISALSSLRVLDLSHNMLQGEVPVCLARLDNLEELYLNNNEFEGYMDLEFSVMPNIRVMALQHNDLVSIPDFSFNDYVDPAQVHLHAENNRLEFYYIENNLNGDGSDLLGAFTYMPQKVYGEPGTLGFVEGRELSLGMRMLGRTNHYQWQLSSDNGGSWTDLEGDAPEYIKSSATQGDEGWYRVKITNDRVHGDDDEILSAILKVQVATAPVLVNRPIE
jgi:Leucine-rich repeat (LRR) protein